MGASPLDTNTVAWSAIIVSLLGVFLTILGTVVVRQNSEINHKLDRLETKLDGKMDIVDHDKQAETCTKTLTGIFNSRFDGFNLANRTLEEKFCRHSHDLDGSLVIRAWGRAKEPV
jgi:hypothetical protein